VNGRRRITSEQVRFLFLAVVLHAGLLLIPLGSKSERPPDANSRPIMVSLQSLKATVSDPAPNPIELPEPVALTKVAAHPAPPAVGAKATPTTRPKEPTVAVLMQQASGLNLQNDKLGDATSPRRLHGAFPRHWTEPLVPAEATAFSPWFAPAETEVLDQWQEPGGTRRIVLRTASGESLCGRQEAWDPHNPLYEPVTLFHRCARR